MGVDGNIRDVILYLLAQSWWCPLKLEIFALSQRYEKYWFYRAKIWKPTSFLTKFIKLQKNWFVYVLEVSFIDPQFYSFFSYTCQEHLLPFQYIHISKHLPKYVSEIWQLERWANISIFKALRLSYTLFKGNQYLNVSVYFQLSAVYDTA